MSSKILSGVITGKQVQEVFALAKEKKFALPAVNVIGNNTVKSKSKSYKGKSKT